MKKHLIFIYLFFVSFIGSAQIESLPNPDAYFSAIIVDNIEISINWYSTNFGLKVLNKIESKEKGFKQANLKRGNMLIELIELDNSVKSDQLLIDLPKKTKIDGFFKIGFSVTEFDKWVAHLKKSKVEFYGNVVKDELSGKKMLILIDPDGNRIQLFEK